MTREEAKEGTFASFYTQKWFLKVKQAFAIDRVCFSFVEKGTNGKGFDIYVLMDDFDNLCDEIINYRLAHRIGNDNGPYPGAWTVATGDNGEKHIAIGKGQQKPVVIQGRNTETNKNAFIGVEDYGRLLTMAKWYRRVSKKYYDELSETCFMAVVHKPKEDDAYENIVIRTTGRPFQQDKEYIIPGVTESGEQCFICLDDDALGMVGNWQQFLNDISQRTLKVCMLARKRDNQYLLKKLINVTG